MRASLVLLGLAACRSRAPTPPPAPEPAAGPRVVEGQGLPADLDATEAFFDTRPAYERPLRESGQGGVPGIGGLSADGCAACHTEIAQEWRLSVHAQAWVDPQYQAEIGKSGNRWLCLNCHTPLLVQQDLWPIGLTDADVERPTLVANPGFDAALRDEGITCAACHLVDGRIRGPGLPPVDGAPAPPHEVVADPELASSGLCLRCHQAEATYPGKSFVCTFRTGEEWREGPWDDEGQGCVECHMPAVERPAAIGGPVRTVRRHWWKGSGIPKIPGRYPPEEANVPGLDLQAAWADGALTLVLTNANAGHRLPTGDPERWVQVDVTFTADGAPVGEPWSTRIGQVWEWSTPPRKVSDDRLAPRESRTLPVPVPTGATRARIQASSHRISEENAAFHHLDGYPRSVVTHTVELDLAR